MGLWHYPGRPTHQRSDVSSMKRASGVMNYQLFEPFGSIHCKYALIYCEDKLECNCKIRNGQSAPRMELVA